MSGTDAPARSFPWRACDRCEQPDQCKADSRTCADRAQFPTLCAAVEGTGLLPCPFRCQGKPHEFVSWGMQQVTCYGTGGNNHAPFTLRRDAWNTRTAPPARTYAEGVEDAAKVADGIVGESEGGERYDAGWDDCAVAIEERIRLLSQGEKV